MFVCVRVYGGYFGFLCCQTHDLVLCVGTEDRGLSKYLDQAHGLKQGTKPIFRATSF